MVQITERRAREKPLELAFFAVAIIAVLAGLSIYVIWPFAKFLLDYPLAPVRWLALKVYAVIYWIFDWIVYILKAAAWCAFYIHFLNKFVEGFLWAIDRVVDDPKTGNGTAPTPDPPYSPHREGYTFPPPQDDSDDDDEPPPLI